MGKGTHISKTVSFRRDDIAMLKQKAALCCLSESGLLRMLLRGFEPHEKPGPEFYEAAEKLSRCADRLAEEGRQEDAELLYLLIADIQRNFLRPEKSKLQWE